MLDDRVHEEIYLFEHATVTALRAGLAKWFTRYNDWRPHETLDNLTPTVVYQTKPASPHNAPKDATSDAA